MDKLYIDIGNSFIKVSERKEYSWHTHLHMRNQSALAAAEELNRIDGLKDVVVASVRQDVLDVLEANLDRKISLTKLHTGQIPSFYLDYDSPGTLGIDRFLTCLAACTISTGNVIVIDTGSACTIDMMTGDFVYRGGVIMPGVGLFEETMKALLPELPSTDRHLPDHWPGRTTDECIRWGVYGSFLHSIRSFVDKFAQRADGNHVYITGGGAAYVLEHLGGELDLIHRADLIFEGMQEFESGSFIQK
ncbi:type III pantothenate kinase [Rhodohalobacter mucosus]|nr:type III pantothenate kinase [Rhodohalobacter mucosus]